MATNNSRKSKRGTSVSQARKTGLLNNPTFKARAEKVIFEIIEELDNLPVCPETGAALRGSAKGIIDEHLDMHHWLTRDMILSKRNGLQKPGLQKLLCIPDVRKRKKLLSKTCTSFQTRVERKGALPSL